MAPVGHAPGVSELGSAVGPDEGNAAELVRLDPVVEPVPQDISLHRPIVTQSLAVFVAARAGEPRFGSPMGGALADGCEAVGID
jgi:hypothetical protein